MAVLRNAGTRQNTWAIRLKVNGQDFDVWDKKTGGEIDSEDGKYSPGAMRPPIDLGGQKNTGNVTLERYYDRIDDHSKINILLQAAGSGQVVITQRPMDPDGNEFGPSITYVGRLKRVSPPDTDSESNTAAMLSVECVIRGYPSAV